MSSTRCQMVLVRRGIVTYICFKRLFALWWFHVHILYCRKTHLFMVYSVFCSGISFRCLCGECIVLLTLLSNQPSLTTVVHFLECTSLVCIPLLPHTSMFHFLKPLIPRFLRALILWGITLTEYMKLLKRELHKWSNSLTLQDQAESLYMWTCEFKKNELKQWNNELEMCPTEHVWPASQHPIERDATIIKNNNVRSFFQWIDNFLV